MKIIYTDHHKLHVTENITLGGFPFIIEEIPQRIEEILAALQAAGIGPLIQPTDHGLSPILGVHDTQYIEYLQSAYENNAAFYRNDEPAIPETFAPRSARRRPKHVLGLKGYYGFGTGSPINAGTWTAAYWSAQCALSAAELIRSGEEMAYALCRPPGHHAARDLYGGFCYLNNAAIAARHLPGKVAILDIDYHHGNGTQEIFYDDPTVFYCSIHAHPDYEYPYYWGDASEIGAGAGSGYNLNLPLPSGTEDAAYLATLEQGVQAIRQFQPLFLIVSVGFDILTGDPAGGFKITLQGLAEISKQIAALHLPTILIQEGGYQIDELGKAAVAFLKAFA